VGAGNRPSVIPDDVDVFRHLAKLYSFTHPTMHHGAPCPNDGDRFPDGITSGSAWYIVTGRDLYRFTFQMLVCLQIVFCSFSAIVMDTIDIPVLFLLRRRVVTLPLPFARQHSSYGDCLEVKREYYQNCSVLDCVTQCSQSAAHLYEQFLQFQQIGFVTSGPLCHA